MTSYIPAQPLPPWELLLSNNVVIVRAIDTTTNMCCNSVNLVEPDIPGNENLNLPTIAFLVEHKPSGKKVLFDCGSRKDYWNFPPFLYQALLKAQPGLKIEKNVNEILEGGCDLMTIDSIVWSHWHWDHIGDASQFPKSTEIVVGPGFKEKFMPGYPLNPSAPLPQDGFEEREIREIAFVSNRKIGPYESFDFFGDGSFYLLNVPGHAIGHIGGLARTTPRSFVFFGGDVCHFVGAFRPTQYSPMPATIPEDVMLDSDILRPCPCSLFTASHPEQEYARTKPFYSIATGKGGQPSFYSDPIKAQRSVNKLTEYDAHPDIFVCVAHDRALVEVLPLFNNNPQADINDWQAQGYKNKTVWGFLNELPRQGRQGRPGRPPLILGFWREGELIQK